MFSAPHALGEVKLLKHHGELLDCLPLGSSFLGFTGHWGGNGGVPPTERHFISGGVWFSRTSSLTWDSAGSLGFGKHHLASLVSIAAASDDSQSCPNRHNQAGQALPANPFLGTSRVTMSLRVSLHLPKEPKGGPLIPLLPHLGRGERSRSQEQSHWMLRSQVCEAG